MPIAIMAVDDEPNTINLLRIVLEVERPDWNFYGAASGQEALDMAASTPPDFVLLDIMMPEMDGIEVCRRLRALPATAKTPIVMLTAMDDPHLREAAQAAGADDFWQKPFTPSRLLPAIDHMLELARNAGSSSMEETHS